jgi:hypothetical protein
MGIVGFVMFKDDKGKDLDGEGVFAVFANGLIRSCMPIEFYDLRKTIYSAVPIRRESIKDKARYQEYDAALRS